MASTKPYPSLSHFVGEIFRWRTNQDLFPYCKTIKDEEGTVWNLAHIGAVLSYALKLSSSEPNSCSAMIHGTLSRLDDIASSILQGSIALDIIFKKACSFIPDFQILFMPPKLQHWSDVADFFNFLLLIMYSSAIPHEAQIALLCKELRFLLDFLGDIFLKHTENLEEVKDLLMKIGVTAQSVGAFVYGCYFSEERVSISSNIGAYISAELQRMEDIKADIKGLCTIFSQDPTADVVAVESLFIVDSFIGDLDDIIMMNEQLEVDLDVGIGEVIDEIKTLHQQMTSSLSILGEIKLNVWEISDLRELAVQLRDTAYEAEYLIKSFFSTEDASFTWYLTLRLPNVIQKMKFIDTALKEIKTNYDNIRALRISRDIISEDRSLQTIRSFIPNDIVVGFDEKETEILDQLVGGEKRLTIITICGMPGLGKTTFAKKLYNHPSVGEHFDKHSWIVISQTYHIKKLLVGTLMNLDRSLDEKDIFDMKEEIIMEKIHKTLKGRRYLVVMDDIWNSDLWDGFWRYFPDDGNGSRILFTSRINDGIPHESIIHGLPFLTEDQCWELLEKKVFGQSNCPPQLEGIGRQIAANCAGLPLTVVVIAGILATMDKTESMWEKVKESIDSYLFADPEHCMKILELSYRHLPDNLKPCFLYFGRYLEDEKIKVSELLALWNAEGFVPRLQDKSPGSIAEEYLLELVNRSLVLVLERGSTGGVKRCGIHDLLHELCLRIAKEENFMKWIGGTGDSIYKKHHRLCWNDSDEPSWLPFGLYVRSFSGDLPYLALCLQNMKLLRLLNLPDMRFHEDMQDSIALLVHVRYLCVDRCLSTSMLNLVNLEYLIMSYCPKNFLPFLLKLPKLRHLRIRNGGIKNKESLDISGTTSNLWYLDYVDIETLKDEEILKSCPHLQKLKCWFRPISVNEEEQRYPDLRFLTKLESLNMLLKKDRMAFYKRYFPELRSREKLSHEINFPSNIKKLTLCRLQLHWGKMSIIGKLPKLEVLKLLRFAFVGETWETKDDEFKELIFLKLDEIGFKKWDVGLSEHFPRLERVVLRKCSKLQEIPSEIGDIPTLQQILVEEGCSASAVESAARIMKEQQEMGNTDLKIIIPAKIQ